MNIKKEVARLLAQEKMERILAKGPQKILSLMNSKREFEYAVAEGNQYLVWIYAMDGVYDHDEVTIAIDVFDKKFDYEDTLSSKISFNTFSPLESAREVFQKPKLQKKNTDEEPQSTIGSVGTRPTIIHGVPITLDRIHHALRRVEWFLSNNSEKTLYMLVDKSIRLKNSNLYTNLRSRFPVKVVRSKIHRHSWRGRNGIWRGLLELESSRAVSEFFYALVTRLGDRNKESENGFLKVSWGGCTTQVAHRILEEITERYAPHDAPDKGIDSLVGITRLDKLEPRWFAYGVYLSLWSYSYDLHPVEFSSHGPEAPAELATFFNPGSPKLSLSANEKTCEEKPI